jgi:uncharacterized delta-60 repeat protein
MKNVYLILLIGIINPLFLQGQSIDRTFQNPLPIRAADIHCVKVLPDKKILVGGDINFYQDQQIKNLLKLTPDGQIDETFNFQKEGSFYIRQVEYLDNGEIIALAQEFEEGRINSYFNDYRILHLNEDGTIKKESHTLLGITSITVYNDDIFVYGRNGQEGFLFRLNSDFDTDSTFATFNGVVNHVVVDNDKLYVAGNFSIVNGKEYNDVVKLNLDGTIDESFSTGSGTGDVIGSITLQKDGKLLLGKCFINTFNGSRFSGTVRLNSDGSIDTGFNPPKFNGAVSELYIKGEEIYAATALSIDNVLKRVVLKLNMDGSRDENFSAVELDYGSIFYFSMGFDGDTLILNQSSSKGSKFGLSKYNWRVSAIISAASQ